MKTWIWIPFAHIESQALASVTLVLRVLWVMNPWVLMASQARLRKHPVSKMRWRLTKNDAWSQQLTSTHMLRHVHMHKYEHTRMTHRLEQYFANWLWWQHHKIRKYSHTIFHSFLLCLSGTDTVIIYLVNMWGFHSISTNFPTLLTMTDFVWEEGLPGKG